MSEKIKADICAARETICSAISDWTQTKYKYGDPIPTFANGSFTGYLKVSLMTQNERIEKIVRPVILTTPSTNEELKTLKKLVDHCEASIKDISEIISDVSEKTVQRELNAMIDENIVKRQGERRWSKYSIF